MLYFYDELSDRYFKMRYSEFITRTEAMGVFMERGKTYDDFCEAVGLEKVWCLSDIPMPNSLPIMNYVYEPKLKDYVVDMFVWIK